MGQFYIVKPVESTNLITNPSFETNTTGWTASSASIARSSTYQNRGIYSLAVTPTSTTTAGVYFGTIATTTGVAYTFSVDIFAPDGIPYRIYFASTGGSVLGTPTTFNGNGDWQRVSVTYTETSGASRRLYVVKNASADTQVFYIDGAQAEALAVDTTYIDGDREGCYWLGAVHGSRSVRDGQYRRGGYRIDLEEYGAYLVSQQGTGMPALKTSSSPFALRAGSFFQRQVATERAITLAFSQAGDGVQEWHYKRQLLLDLISPDATSGDQTFLLGYDGAGARMEIACVYDSGMEIQSGKLDIETAPIRLIAHDPFWYRDGERAAAIAANSTVTSSSLSPGTSEGIGLYWDLRTGSVGKMGSNATFYTSGAASFEPIPHPDGYWIVVSPNALLVGMYDGTTMTTLMTPNGVVTGIVVNVDGSIYVSGKWTSFTDTSGATQSIPYAAKWDGSTWSSIFTVSGTATGIEITVRATTLDDTTYWMGSRLSGTLTITGTLSGSVSTSSTGVEFTTRPSDAGTYRVDPPLYVADGYAGSTMMSGSLRSQDVYFMATKTSVLYVCKFDGTNITAYPFLSTFGATAEIVGPPYISNDGRVFFSVINDSLYETIYEYNGTGFEVFARYIASSVLISETKNAVTRTRDGRTFLDYRPMPQIPILMNANPITSATSIRHLICSSTELIGKSMLPTGVCRTVSDSSESVRLIHHPNGLSAIIRAGNASSITYPARTNVTYNGRSRTYPKIVLVGPGTIVRLSNRTTNKTIWCDTTVTQTFVQSFINGLTQFYPRFVVQALAGETLTIDTNTGSVTSSRRGEIIGLIAPQSEISDFYLQPGVNAFELTTRNTTASSGVFMVWRDKYWSVDGGAV
ncbi:MAG: hypothetical protein E6R03_15135 [Hyphomicrobiaceae bacterium]|nr:MAG: hypothetical protein E6R03_15135 [Hyphomicrobiaceae bacterium]